MQPSAGGRYWVSDTLSGIVDQASREADHIVAAMPALAAQLPVAQKSSLEIGG
jgi:hypothetical protein